MNMIEVCDISLRIGQHEILHDIHFCVEKGKILGIIGPNGSGKSTLIKVISRLLVPSSGMVTVDGREISAYSPKMLARKMAVVSQEGFAPLPITVREAVAMGRYPYHRLFRSNVARDAEAIQRALMRTGLTGLADQPLEKLSGGERQRAAIACALAQEPEVLLLDEPTTYLDIGHQIGILDVVREWRQETGGTAVLVLHDLNLAAQYCDCLLLMENGKITQYGGVEEIIEANLLAGVYGVKPLVITHPNLHLPQILLERSS
ncbi:iron complex transport system ATP-binding protein [Aneurinibacillus thermoaerophilus]|uniref:Iron complex transport system ATP-binding protein n=2 Tax=Aneurinibacillus thermoaerophilus TaxID=143495 RepID=A0A1G8CKA3_ANETH|nr:iron complex transport system ATP-binding protein [Aneurinibacillus thermoaerophilus]